MRRPGFGELWSHRGYRLLWIGETLSTFGSEVGSIGFVLVAAIVVGVTPIEMSAMIVAGTLPGVALGLVAGAWVDRVRRAPLIVAVNVGRAAVIAVVAVLVVAGRADVTMLVVTGIVYGSLEAIAQPAYEAYLPTLVGRDRLVEANARLQMGRSAAGTVGPGIGGLLVQALTIPIVLAVDAVSFLVAAVAVALIDAPDDRGRPATERRTLATEIGAGLRAVAADPRLRPIAGAAATAQLVGAFTYTNWVLYVASLVGDDAGAVLGVLFTAGSAAFLVAATIAPRVGRRLGIGGAIVAGALLVLVSPFFMPLAPSGNVPVAAAFLAAAAVVGATGDVIAHVHLGSVVQAVTPDALLGRVSSATTVLRSGGLLVGTVLGGIVGTQVGLREAIWVSAIGHLIPFAIIAASPLRRLHDLPAPGPAPAPAS